MSAGHPTAPRSLAIASVVAVVALAVGSATFVALLANGQPSPLNGAQGAVSCPAHRPPGTTVDVTVADAGNSMMGQAPMMATVRTTPSTVPAGQVTFVVLNEGALVHEMVVLPLPSDGPGTRTTGIDGKIDESQSLGEASRSCAAGTGSGIVPGSTGWTTVILAPGRYELVCDEPWHYAAGMFDVLTVG
ncbi:MAG TPA: hypothetical protein VFC03_08465 [Acidimicrobiales bacterium]|nr:hypothetical protein [Acidimicrobiales bacterium]